MCQLEHLYTGAPQVVTDLATYQSFLTSDVAAKVPSNGRGYFPGGMPHGFWFPTFDPEDVAKAIEHTVEHLDEMKVAAKKHPFKSWSLVCNDFLEDMLMLTEGPVASVSVPVLPALPSA
jgi:hypothetical protein